MVTSRSIVAFVRTTRHPWFAKLYFLLPLPVWVWLVSCTPPLDSRLVVASLCESLYWKGVCKRRWGHAWNYFAKGICIQPYLSVPWFYLLLFFSQVWPLHMWPRPTPVFKSLVLYQLSCTGCYLHCCCIMSIKVYSELQFFFKLGPWNLCFDV